MTSDINSIPLCSSYSAYLDGGASERGEAETVYEVFRDARQKLQTTSMRGSSGLQSVATISSREVKRHWGSVRLPIYAYKYF